MNDLKFELTGNDNLDKLLIKINKGADVNIQDHNENKALILASTYGYIDIVKLLLENGADVNIKGKYGHTALMRASYKGDIEICKVLIKNGADINIQNKSRNTALIRGAYHGRTDVCKYLIENGADINLQNDEEETALVAACRYNTNVDLCKFLIENGADLNIQDKNGLIEIDYMKDKGIYEEINPYKIWGLKYFKEVFKEDAEAYMDIFNTTLYSQDLELDDIKANIDMFYSNVIARTDNKTINESLEL